MLDQVPAVPIQVFKHGHGSVILVPWGLHKRNAPIGICPKISLEIVSVEKEEHPSAGLALDTRNLLGGLGSRKQDAALPSSMRREHNPAFGI